MIKVVALDVYGTILACDDHDYACAPRQGLENLLAECRQRNLLVVTSSDAYIHNVKTDLQLAFDLVPERELRLDRFHNFFQLDQPEKDFSLITGFYGISPGELLVVGDNPVKDIQGATITGAKFVLCPVYSVSEGKDWDLGQIDLDV